MRGTVCPCSSAEKTSIAQTDIQRHYITCLSYLNKLHYSKKSPMASAAPPAQSPASAAKSPA
jgi:hypothetical protein